MNTLENIENKLSFMLRQPLSEKGKRQYFGKKNYFILFWSCL